VSFTVSPPPQGAPITSYVVTSSPGGVVVSIPPPASGNIGTALVGGLTNGVSYTFTVQAVNLAGTSAPSAPSNAVVPSAAHVPVLNVAISGPSSVSSAPAQVTYTITVTNPLTATSAFPANVSVTHTLSPVRAVIDAAGASRNGTTGIVTITTTGSHGLNIGQSITIAGVTDPSFNGTFTIQDVPSPTMLTYAQAGATASSGSGTVTGLPLANIMLAQTSQGTCTAGGTGVITVTCNQGSLAAGASSTMTVIVQIQSQAILNSVVASGTDAAGTALANANASLTTTVPLPATSNLSAAVGITGTPQSPTPNVGQTDSITWKVTNVSATPTPNVQLTIFIPTGLTITGPNPPTPTFDNGGTGSCSASTPVAGGNQIVCITSTLGGAKKNGAKPPTTMTVITTVAATAAIRNIAVHPSGTVAFGPGGIDTLPNSVTLTITAK
jgi:large repetitive protein